MAKNYSYHSSRLLFISVTILCLGDYSNAFVEYGNAVPNGNNIAGFPAIGHVANGGGGVNTAFGNAFLRAGFQWTRELCEADSDGDGFFNGQELGDPCCILDLSAAMNESLSHPGNASEVPAGPIFDLTLCDTLVANPVETTADPSSSSSDNTSSSGIRGGLPQCYIIDTIITCLIIVLGFVSTAR